MWRIVFAIVFLSSTYSFPSLVGSEDPLNSFADGRSAKCGLKPGERKWLEAAMAKGEIRLTTEADKKAWEALAQSKNRPNSKFVYDCGRTYTILKNLIIPGKIGNERFSGDITFVVDKGVPFPHLGSGNGCAIYDLNTGGWYQSGSYDDGTKESVGYFPTSTQKRRIQD